MASAPVRLALQGHRKRCAKSERIEKATEFGLLEVFAYFFSILAA